MTTWENITPGVLIDEDIRKLCPSKLVTGNYDPEFVRQTCYELRVGEIVWHTYIREPSNRKVSIKEQGGVYLPPKGYTTIITKEEVELPEDCVGRIMTKGQLFSIGISAVNTYVDPGFSGPLGITLMNHSSRPIFIPIGEPIAKIEFVKLSRTVKEPYKGPHLKSGNLWPIPDSYYNIPSFVDTKEYPVELKDLAILEIERKISLIKDELTTRKRTIRVLFIIAIPLIISSILYWVSNWASMSVVVQYMFLASWGVMGVLAGIPWWWNLVSGFVRLFKKSG